MAKFVGAFGMSHSSVCYMPPERWNARQSKRSMRPDVPVDSLEECQRKASRLKQAYATLRQKMAEVKPDAVLIFGDDQLECFDFRNFPAFAVYVGPEFSGHVTASHLAKPEGTGMPDAPMQRVPGHSELGVGLLTGLMKRGFDMAYCMDIPKPENGLGHAFMRPAETLADFNIPMVPVLFNCFYAPQPSAMRCYQLGRAVRDVIDAYPGDLRVAVVGSGGLWHTPRKKNSYIDHEFDRHMVDRLKVGDARGMAEHFDNYRIPEGDTSQDVGQRGPEVTGMPGPGGPQGGTRETTTWIAAAATCEGRPWTVVDYVPIFSTPMGAGMAYCAA
jgi:Catalytic LigB subunit of aromatic ring-opening dioxygenase